MPEMPEYVHVTAELYAQWWHEAFEEARAELGYSVSPALACVVSGLINPPFLYLERFA